MILYKKRLKELFKASGLSYKQLAKELDLHWVTLIKLANAKDCGKYNISLKSLSTICAYFDIQPSEILESTPDKKMKKKGRK